MTAEQMSRAARALAYADDPQYVALMLRISLDLTSGEVIALRELVKVEKQRRQVVAA